MVFTNSYKNRKQVYLYVINGVWAVPATFLMRAIRNFKLIRVGTFNSSRIGHYGADVGHQFIKQKLSTNSNIVDLYWLNNKTSNMQWDKMVKRNFLVYAWVKYVDRWNDFIPGGEVHKRASSQSASRDIGGIIYNSKCSMMKFSHEEESIAKNFLKKLGWYEGQPFVCVQVRDSAYLNETFKDNDWSYHDYRDSDINTYIPALEWLANNDILIIRMGKITKQNIISSSLNIIDYSSLNNCDDLLDVWLFANCLFCITTGSGPDMISDVYKRPLLCLNYIPITHLFSWSYAVHVPKKLYHKNGGKMLSWSDYLRYNFGTSSIKYEEADIKIVDLSSDEILESVKEMLERVKGVWVDSKRDIKMHNRFWSMALKDKNFNEVNRFIHPESRISTVFFRNNLDWVK